MNVLKKMKNIIFGFAILLGIWEVLMLVSNQNTVLFPSPVHVGKAIVDMVQDGSIFVHIQSSLFRFFSGYLFGVVAAVGLGLLIGRVSWLWNIVNSIIQFLRPIAPVAWAPFIVLWFGIGDMPAIVIIFIATFYPVLLSTVSAMQNIDSIYLKVGQNFSFTRWEMMRKIYLPASFPMIISGMRMALGAAWIFLVTGEMIGAQSGLGYLIVDARNAMNLDDVMAGIVFIGLLGFLFDKCILWYQAWVNQQWGQHV